MIASAGKQAPKPDFDVDGMSTEQLLRAYKETGREDLKWPLVLRYEGLIKSIALQIRGVYSSFAQVDDIISEGVIALAAAIDRFDPDKGIKLETYVAKRLRGMIIDLARRQDWTPRSVRKRSREIDEATSELFNQLGRFPSDAEVAEKLGITVARYQEDLVNTALCNVISFESLFEDRDQAVTNASLPCADPANQPEQVLQEQELLTVLTKAIEALRENEQLVLSLYYQKNLNMKEIAQVMGVSEPRVSQVHAKAIQKLRVTLGKYMKSEL